MFLNALLVSLAVGVCYFTNEWFCRLFNDKPIIIGTIVGFLLGDPVTGIICGGTYELIFLGAVNIGGTVPSDALTGTAIATTFIILTDMGMPIPDGLLIREINIFYGHPERFIREASCGSKEGFTFSGTDMAI